MASTLPQLNTPNPQLIWDTLNGYQRTAALRAAINLELFTTIGGGATTVPAIADRCKASERGVRILCDYLTVIGFLTKSANAYALTPTTAEFLDQHSPRTMASMSRFLNSPRLMAGFNNLTETVRQGTTQLPDGGCTAPEYDEWVIFAEAMTPVTRAITAFIADEAARGSAEPPRRVLDIAAGHGLYGIAVAGAVPHAHIVAQDWPNVLAVATRNAISAGVYDRFEVLPGDAFAVDFGTNYDVVLLTNFLHHFDPPVNIALLKKIHASLSPQGRVITLEFVPNDDRISPPIPATFSLMMLGLTPAGDAYTAAELRNMTQQAGFSDTRFVEIPQTPQQVMVSTK